MDAQNVPIKFLTAPKASLFNLALEEETLASIPFAVLEQRVGKKTDKFEVKGKKILPDGTEVQVTWQVQGNNELGLPTEQDLDIFVALGVLTFRQNFAKTVTFHGQEIARILNIKSVHGKFYNRIKIAMDRFIPLRFRELRQTDEHEEVKWVNVFQEAAFSHDRETGRCTGVITWTDRIIQSMDRGFFRLLDAGRYMSLDGITTKHMYRFLAIAFAQTDTVIIDARILAAQHLGIVHLPKYFSRLLQTLEPALEQLRQQAIVRDWHIVSKADWRLAIRSHPDYVPERRALTEHAKNFNPDLQAERCIDMLEKAGLPADIVLAAREAASGPSDFYALDRTAHLLMLMLEEGVMAHVAHAMARKVLEDGANSDVSRDTLDWIEIGLSICAQKRRGNQAMRNGAGLIVKLARDEEARKRLVNADLTRSLLTGYRKRERAELRRCQEAEEHSLIAEAFFTACETGQGWEVCRAYCSPGATFSAQAEPLLDVKTLAAYTDWMKGILSVLPDGRYEIKSFATDAARDNVAAYGVFHGTHTGEGGPVPPTGRSTSTDYVYVMQFEGDKIVHMTKIWNAGFALRELGWT